jgi:ABC-type transport system substrate-binding protein
VARPFIRYAAAVALFVAAVGVSVRTEAMPFNAVLQQSTAQNVVYVGAKVRAFAGCYYAGGQESDQRRRYNSMLACMGTKGYSGWCMKNAMCFEAARLDAILVETFERLL